MMDYTLIFRSDSIGFRITKQARPLSVLIRQIMFIRSEKIHGCLKVGC